MDEAEKHRQFAAWVEDKDARWPVYDWMPGLWDRPLYARETIDEPVEPYHSSLQSLKSQLPYDCPECGGDPDPDLYQPTEKLLNLRKGIAALEPKAWRTVPNPAYDPERAAAWKARQRTRFPARIEIGQSYTPDP